jgi:hypothetical protein
MNSSSTPPNAATPRDSGAASTFSQEKFAAGFAGAWRELSTTTDSTRFTAVGIEGRAASNLHGQRTACNAPRYSE